MPVLIRFPGGVVAPIGAPLATPLQTNLGFWRDWPWIPVRMYCYTVFFIFLMTFVGMECNFQHFWLNFQVGMKFFWNAILNIFHENFQHILSSMLWPLVGLWLGFVFGRWLCRLIKITFRLCIDSAIACLRNFDSVWWPHIFCNKFCSQPHILQ